MNTKSIEETCSVAFSMRTPNFEPHFLQRFSHWKIILYQQRAVDISAYEYSDCFQTSTVFEKLIIENR